MDTATPIRKPLAAILLQGMLLIAVCLPTGSIFGFNVKIPVFAIFAATFVFYLATHSAQWISSGELIFLALFTAALCFWGLLAIFQGQSDTTQIFLHLKDISTTVILAWLCIFFVRKHLLRPGGILIPVIAGTLILASMKLLLVVVTLGLGIDPIQLLGSVFGEDALVGGSMAFGLTRIEFPSDIIGSFALFALLCPSLSGLRWPRWFVMLACAVLIASGLLAFARYIWLLEAFAMIAASVIERRHKLLLALVLIVLPLGVVNYEILEPLIGARFSSEQVSDSDLIRIEQSKALLDSIQAHPLLGKGLGTHVTEVIRSDQNQYSYELQWLSLLMQFGFAGILAIFVMVAASARDLLYAHHPAKPWLALLFALWLLSGWTNPHLVSSFAGATFGMFMVLFYRMRHHSLASGEFA